MKRSITLAIAAVLLAACGSSTIATTPTPTLAPPPSPAPTSTAGGSVDDAQQQAVYEQIEQQVVAIRELAPKQPVTPVLLDEAGLKAELAKQAAADASAAEIQQQQRLLQSLGVLPADADLNAILTAFQGSQVAGFYVPRDGNLYVVSRSGGLGPVEKTTFAHEFTHALQDQHFPLLDEMDAQPPTPANADRDLGRLALIEGDASLSMTYWAQQHLSPLELLSILGQSLDPAQMNALNAMPPFLRQTTLFPYQDGLQFVLTLQTGGGWQAVDDVFGTPPASTEQILHPDKYRVHEAPIAVTLPADLPAALGSGWSTDSADTLGELQLRAWLTARGVPEATSTTAAAGWGGDRVARYQGPNGAWALVIDIAWDQLSDDSEFVAAATTATASGDPAAVVSKSGRTFVVIASDQATLAAARAAIG
jgi:hypothetical protein